VVVISPRPLAPAVGEDGAEPALYSLSFAEATLAEATGAVLGDALGLAYVIDPRVSGRITLQTPQPLGQTALLGLFETALKANGAALIVEGTTARVVPVTEALGLTLDAGRGQPGMGATLLPLQHVAAETVRQLLDGFATRPGTVRADPPRNLVILTGTAGERRSAAAAVAALDVPGLAQRALALVPLGQAEAADVAKELVLALNAQPGGPREQLVKVEALPRLNALLVAAVSADLLAEAQRWIGTLDQGQTSQAVLRSYRVDYAAAPQVVQLLQTLFGLGAGTGAGGVAPGLTPSTSGEAAPAVAGAGPRQTLRLAADEATNSVVVVADAAGHRLVVNALRELDRAPAQVLVDATIAEVTLNDRLRFGVQFFFESAGIDGLGQSGRGGFGLGPGFDANGSFPGFNFLMENGTDARVALEALSAVTDVEVVSMPTVMVLENQEASLRVGDQVPVVTRQATSVQDPNAPLVNSVEFKDTGVFLSVTPRVASTNLITLQVTQEVSNVSASANTGDLTPTISRREITSTVAAPSGQTLVLGGLIGDERTVSRTGVPVLSDLPLIGQLFGVSENRAERTELLVFITARVLPDPDANAAVTRELIERAGRLAAIGQPPAPTSPDR
jgi:general secretion pathway protein D